jgi:CYTH domain-containing protein
MKAETRSTTATMKKNAMTVENEKRYLVAAMPDISGITPMEIEQQYLIEDSSLRIRATDGRAFELTKKFDLDPATPGLKDERTVELDEAEYIRLKQLTDREVLKTRYRIPLDGGLVAELDVYRGPLSGLLKVEVEFGSHEQRNAFTPPSWFGRDVTGDAWASNSELAGKTYAEIEHLVKNGS